MYTCTLRAQGKERQSKRERESGGGRERQMHRSRDFTIHMYTHSPTVHDRRRKREIEGKRE